MAALDRQGSDGRSPHPDIVAQSRSSPHEERELDIQRLGQRPVDHSASYHFDHPSSRRYDNYEVDQVVQTITKI